MKIILDTFADSDRGYFVRTGLVDRRYNPKLGSHVVGNLIALLDGARWVLAEESVALTGISGDRLILLLPGDGVPAWPVGAHWVDLATGAIHRKADGLAAAPRPLIVKLPAPA